MKVVTQEELMIDVGAGNKDNYQELLRIKPGLKIHAFEPHPDIAKSLSERFARDERVFIHEVACISSSNKTAKFWMCSPSSCSSTLPLIKENFRKWKYPAASKLFDVLSETEVKAVNLSEFIQSHLGSFKQINYLNIDVQGDSLNVLKGLRSEHLERVSEISVKLHTIDWELYAGQSKVSDVTEYLIQNGFTKTTEVVMSRGQEVSLTFVKVNPIKSMNRLHTEQMSRRPMVSPPIRANERIGGGINTTRIRKK